MNRYDIDRIHHFNRIFERVNDLDNTRQANADEILRARSNIFQFPNASWFKGNYQCPNPIISRRLGGYAPLQGYFSRMVLHEGDAALSYPQNCYQIPHHTVKPITSQPRCCCGGRGTCYACRFTHSITHQP